MGNAHSSCPPDPPHPSTPDEQLSPREAHGRAFSYDKPRPGTPRDVPRAMRLYQVAVTAGLSDAMYRLGRIYSTLDDGGPNNRAEAMRLFSAGADAGNVDAINALAVYVIEGDPDSGVPGDVKRAFELFDKAIEGGCGKAMYCKANIHYLHHDRFGVDRDVKLAMNLYRRAIKVGDTSSLLNLGMIYERHYVEAGVERGIGRATELYALAAEAGLAEGMFSLANMYASEDPTVRSVVTRDVKRAIRLHRQAIDAGHRESLNSLGVIFRHGDEAGGVPKDIPEAVRLFEKAMEFNDADALYNLGFLYHTGDEFFKRDIGKAVYHYERAVDLGHSMSMNTLAMILREGNSKAGIPRDLKRAAGLYEKAIEAGETNATFNFAQLLENGEGDIPKDLQRSVTLLKRALDAGHMQALGNLFNILFYGDSDAGFDRDPQQAFEILTREFDKAEPTAIMLHAKLIGEGITVPTDMDFVQAKRHLNDAAESGVTDAHAVLGLLHRKGAHGIRRDLQAAFNTFEEGWRRGDSIAGYLLADCLLWESSASTKDAERAKKILEQIVTTGFVMPSQAVAEYAALLERGEENVSRDPKRSAELYLQGMEQPLSSKAYVHTASIPIIKSGPYYPRIVRHVLTHGTATLRKCLLLTLGGASRGKSATLRSIKRMSFQRDHIQTEMADFFSFVSYSTGDRLDEGLIAEIDFNDSSLPATAARSAFEEASASEPLDFPEEVTYGQLDTWEQRVTKAEKVVEENATRDHSDVFNRVRHAMLLPEFGSGFKSAAVDAWDMGGQSEYEMSHSLFVERANILVFVANLSNVSSPLMREAEVNLLGYWIQFAFVHVPNPEKVSVVVVGTHRDDCPNSDWESALKKLRVEIRARLANTSGVYETWFGDADAGEASSRFIAIENSSAVDDPESSGLGDLEVKIQQLADKIVEERAPVPIRWIAFVDKLSRLGESFFTRGAILQISQNFPGCPVDAQEREADVLAGLRAFASMGKLVIFELSEDEWYVFLDVERIVKSVGAPFARYDTLKRSLPDREIEDLKRGMITKYWLFDLWKMRNDEKEIMYKLLISFDLLIDLCSDDGERSLVGIPALFDIGADEMTWRPWVNARNMKVVSCFATSIPAGVIGRLMAFLHRTLSPSSPNPSLIRQDAALISIADHGRVFVTFLRVEQKLEWVFEGDDPIRLAHLCLKKVDALFRSSSRRVNVSVKHCVMSKCSVESCRGGETVELNLTEDWMNQKDTQELPNVSGYCCLRRCKKEWRSDDIAQSIKQPFGGCSSAENHPQQLIMPARRYDVFISHAGPDKFGLAQPLYQNLKRNGLRCFLDCDELHCSVNNAPKQMEDALDEAKLGIFILSPEFATRRWPMKELRVFLTRNESARHPPALLPVFYRLTPEDCMHFYQGFNLFKNRFWTGAFRDVLDEAPYISEVQSDAEIVKRLGSDLESVRKFAGVDCSEVGGGRRLSDAAIMDKTVEEALVRLMP